ncbi:glycosyltransferase [Bradyrhizobium prioriisuperbiae]|uniref:glycosyltransferase n=1 Tax=Bradyrhizobium prioriisuperbiae TaxID=2854389 RepID=UPI0028E71930|nr:glycosyltransferase [Bradyrhizobium prioritasuperba]
MIRVLHAYKIYLPDVHGGIPHVIATLAKLPRAGFDGLVLVARAFGLGRTYRVDEVLVKAVTSLGTAFSTPMAPSYPFVFARQARLVDVVVCHAPFPLADMGVLLGFPRRAALIVHWHAEIIGRSLLVWLMTPLVRRTLARADKIIVSDAAIVANSKFLQPHALKCVVVPYGCDVDYWGALSESEQAVVDGMKARYPRLVVAVGRLVGYKGYEVFLRATQDVDVQAVIVGDGPLKAELESLAARLGISGRVMILGGLPRDEVKQYIHAASVLAFPSVTDAEAFGLVQLEAMSAGRPIVNTALGTAVPHVARDGQEGLTVPPNDPSAFAQALGRLLDEPELARKLGDAGRVRAQTEYAQSLFLERMQTIYREAAGRRQSQT